MATKRPDAVGCAESPGYGFRPLQVRVSRLTGSTFGQLQVRKQTGRQRCSSAGGASTGLHSTWRRKLVPPLVQDRGAAVGFDSGDERDVSRAEYPAHYRKGAGNSQRVLPTGRFADEKTAKPAPRSAASSLGLRRSAQSFVKQAHPLESASGIQVLRPLWTKFDALVLGHSFAQCVRDDVASEALVNEEDERFRQPAASHATRPRSGPASRRSHAPGPLPSRPRRTVPARQRPGPPSRR